MSEGFVNHITAQLQGYRGDEVEALVVGSHEDAAHIYAVDSQGVVNCFDDVGFAAIGIGAWHAKSRLMQAGYTNRAIFAPALAATFAAKKSAEIAPGVGLATDINIVFKDAVVRLWPDEAAKLEDLYGQYVSDNQALTARIVGELAAFLSRGPDGEKKQFAGGDAQTDERPSSDAAEAPRGNESGEEGQV
jgi:hypothetical protein